MGLFKKRRIYLDYAAATPVRPEVVKLMNRYWNDRYGNPGAVHKEGMEAMTAVSEAREKVARTLRVRSTDVIFTSGGTEGNNLALRGAVEAMLKAGVMINEIEIIATAVEHPSVLRCLERLAEEGCRVVYAPINEDGLVIAEEFGRLLSHRTRLVSIAYANSETGVVQDIGRIARTIRAFEKENGLTVLFHTDACQAPLWLPCALDSLGVDMMTLDAGKCEGPKGVGILVRRARVHLGSVTYGGPQEYKLRPGTEPVSLIAGAAEALSLAQLNHEKRSRSVAKLRDEWIKLLENIPGVILNGSSTKRLSNNVNISVPGLDSEFTVITLDAAGIAASTKSACSARGSGRSHVVFTMTGDDARAASTLRFTLGPNTTWKELNRTYQLLKRHLEEMHNFKLTQ